MNNFEIHVQKVVPQPGGSFYVSLYVGNPNIGHEVYISGQHYVSANGYDAAVKSAKGRLAGILKNAADAVGRQVR